AAARLRGDRGGECRTAAAADRRDVDFAHRRPADDQRRFQLAAAGLASERSRPRLFCRGGRLDRLFAPDQAGLPVRPGDTSLVTVFASDVMRATAAGIECDATSP